MNKYSFDGDSFFLLKAAEDCVINGKKYLKGQPITYFEHCRPIVYYAKKDTNSSVSVSKLAHFYEVAPSSLVIDGISKQQSVSNLIFTKDHDIIYKEEKVEDGTVDDNGRIYLKCSDDLEVSNVFIYGEDSELIKENFTIENNVIIFPRNFNGKTFKIFYSVSGGSLKAVDGYQCTAAKVPYLTGYCIVKGKINGLNGKMIVEFPKLSCSTAPTLNLWGEEMFDSSLSFDCIDAVKNPIRINYIYE